MKNIVWSIVFLLLAGLSVGGFFYLSNKMKSLGSEKMLSVSEMETKGIPDFDFTDLQGKSHKLSDYKGKIVILNFWASWCGPCLEEFPSLIKLIKEFPNDIALIAISQDSAREDIDSFLKSFSEANHPAIVIGQDDGFKIARIYGIDRLPESLITYRDLRLAKKIVGSVEWYTDESLKYIRTLIAPEAAAATTETNSK